MQAARYHTSAAYTFVNNMLGRGPIEYSMLTFACCVVSYLGRAPLRKPSVESDRVRCLPVPARFLISLFPAAENLRHYLRWSLDRQKRGVLFSRHFLRGTLPPFRHCLCLAGWRMRASGWCRISLRPHFPGAERVAFSDLKMCFRVAEWVVFG